MNYKHKVKGLVKDEIWGGGVVSVVTVVVTGLVVECIIFML